MILKKSVPLLSKPLVLCVITLLWCSVQMGYGQEEENQEKVEEQEEEITLEEQRKLTIQYGIDSQLLELIAQLEDENNEDFFPDLKEVFTTTSNTKIQTAVVGFFDAQEKDSLIEEVFEKLKDYDNLDGQVVIEFIKYIENYQSDEITELLFEIIEDPRAEVASAAIKAIGISEKKHYAEQLLELYEDQQFRDALKPPLITALGELKSEVAFELLNNLVKDDDESKSVRWRACQALGKIGGEEAFKTVSTLLNENDPILRSYAIHSLGYFDQEGVVDILIDALRDSMWRVRVQAAEALGRKGATEALDVLKYKAKYDPDVRNVRLTAVKAIGKLQVPEGYKFLRELYSNPQTPLGLRTASIKILVEENFEASIDAVTTVFEEEWDKDKSYILDYTCKMLSTKEAPNSQLEPLYKRMLNHPSHINLLYYGLRGVRLNKISSLKSEVEDLTADNVSSGVQSLAKSVLSEL